MEELSNYKLYLTLLGSLTNLAFFLIRRSREDGIDRESMTISGYSILLFSYLIIGVFAYISFYEDIQRGENKVALVIGLTSYYFINKILTHFGSLSPEEEK